MIDNGELSWTMVQGPAAPLLSLASVGFSAMGSIEGGQGQAAADKYQAEVLDREAQYGELKATQTNAEMTRNLSSTLANIDAVQAARHVAPGPTTMAVRGQTEYVGDEKKGIQVDSLMAQAQMDEANADYLRHASSQALMSGDIGALGGLAGGLGKLAGQIGGMPQLQQTQNQGQF
jgi:hypothetical protein